MNSNINLLSVFALCACASRTNGLNLPPDNPPTLPVAEWIINQTREFSTGRPRWANGQDRMTVVPEDSHDHKVLEVHYPRGVVGPKGGGAQWGVRLAHPADRLKISYDVQFAPGFKFVLGGKLPGLIGGRESGIPVTGGIRPTGRNGWSARLMWLEEGALVQYVYRG